MRNNLHMVFTASPVGADFRVRSQRFLATINSTVIDWFQPWPEASLHRQAHPSCNPAALNCSVSQTSSCTCDSAKLRSAAINSIMLQQQNKSSQQKKVRHSCNSMLRCCSVAKKFLDDVELGSESIRAAVVEFMPYSFAAVNAQSKRFLEVMFNVQVHCTA